MTTKSPKSHLIARFMKIKQIANAIAMRERNSAILKYFVIKKKTNSLKAVFGIILDIKRFNVVH